MKKNSAIVIILLAMQCMCIAQDAWMHSIKQALSVARHDTSRALALADFCNYYKLKRPDSALHYGYKALTLARSINFPKGEVRAMEYLIITITNLGNNSKALQLSLQANKIAEKNNLRFDKAFLMFERATLYRQSRDYIKALNLSREVKKIFESINDLHFPAFALNAIGETYLEMNRLDSALYYAQAAYNNAAQITDNWVSSHALLNLGRILNKLGNTDLALSYFKQALSKALGETEVIFASYFNIAQLYQQIAAPDSALHYARKSFEIAQQSGFYKKIIDASRLLSNLYERKNPQQALLYSWKAITYNDSLNNIVQSTTQETITDFDVQERQREIQDAATEFQNRLRTNAFLGITFTLLVIAAFSFRNSRLKQRAKQNIEQAYEQLKATQGQLVQKEKMASLGELTAGIAHEIQNPLNFVNNFAETNVELIGEAQVELKAGNASEALAILNDIKDNESKIAHHGKRADAIVKGMLQHSRKNSGHKEPTDINALADEYLRLSYHGFRAKDKSFNAALHTHFDKSIGKVVIVPQDIGRVLLNLFNNAFYAVHERLKKVEHGYEPIVTVRTKKLNDKVEIEVKDNGMGISKSLMDKIFQPFFTTKPPGQGTGLGLSLSYDIVKAHGGELKVESNESDGVTFSIQLPSDA